MSDTRYPKRSGPGDYDDLVETPREAASGDQSDDPLAELARLIDEDPFADFNQRRREPPLSERAETQRPPLSEPPVEVPSDRHDTGANQAPEDDLAAYSDEDYYAAQPAARHITRLDEQGRPELPDYQPPAQGSPAYEPRAYEPPAYEPPAYEPPAHATEPPRASQPPVDDEATTAEPDTGDEGFDNAAAERLYADLAAASQRVEPPVDTGPAAETSEPAPVASPRGYDPTADLEANLLAGSPESVADEFDFGDLSGRSGAQPEIRAESRAPDEPVVGDDFYDQTDPVFDDSGHIPPYDGEVPVEGSGRRRGMVIVGEVLVGLVVVGGLGAFAFRSLTDGGSDGPAPIIRADKSPAKVTPQQSDAQEEPQQGKLVYDRVSGDGGNENARLVSREEPVADVGNRQVRVIDPNQGEGAGLRGTASDAGAATADVEDLPKRVRTVVVKPDGTIVGEVQPPKPAEPLQPTSTPTSTSTAAPEADAPDTTSAPADAEDAIPLPTPRPAELAMSQPAAEAPAPAAPTPAPAASPPAPAQSSQPSSGQTSTTQQPGSNFVPPAAPTSRASGGEPIPLQPAPAPANQPAQTTAPAPATQTASAPATTSFPAGSYVVQVAASRNQQDAQSTAAAIKQNYSNVLSGYEPAVERADLGDRGIYYRVGVGPLRTQADANSLCSQLKSAGLDCFVRRN